jgi:hypothetical protein
MGTFTKGVVRVVCSQWRSKRINLCLLPSLADWGKWVAACFLENGHLEARTAKQQPRNAQEMIETLLTSLASQ